MDADAYYWFGFTAGVAFVLGMQAIIRWTYGLKS